jgi:putative pre-16S rRNA nuclease
MSADAPLAPSARPLSFLAFDFGLRRVGVASGNTLMKQASPLQTIGVEGDARFMAIGRLIDEWKPDALVVGVPYHPDGAPHDNTRRAQRFARQLHGRFRLPVHEVDERYSTVEAATRTGQGSEGGIDAVSAAVILEQFLVTL